MRPTHILCLLFVTFLAACGGREPEAVRGIPNTFGDAVPHTWTGRNVPSAYPVHGIDVARYQTSIDWQQASAYGVRFAFVKATEGGDYVDPLYTTHRNAARAAGVPVSAYHYYYFCRTPEEQAAWFIANHPRHRGDLPPVLDMEWTPTSRTCRIRPNPEEVRRQAGVFLNILQNHYGQRPVVYSTVDFFRDNAMWLVPAEFWLRATAGHPSEVHPGRDWHFWQYTGTGLIPGIEGRVDINAFRGSEQEWASWLNTRRIR
ncbi:GH25 family lysozyme [Falsirhodobacter halotolerans]|uniref:GH25 family lysozyme n=1 Tax=Falsirhodobacter halotolerans TaxID=1146892 RepID=UPI001FD33D4D|nr:GH25 family lysozyme [Falsirhodobacter halotolerans]MCJ8138697.1 glycoside hydrolase [Falsirhodobacter halotolerans]